VPDYTKSTGKITITPSFFFGNEDYSSKINDSCIKYYINGSNTAVTIVETSDNFSGDYYQKGGKLYI
jgi:hypothetical protein